MNMSPKAAARRIRLERTQIYPLGLPHSALNRRLAEACDRLGAVALSDVIIRTELCHLITAPAKHTTGEHLHPHLELSLVTAGSVTYVRAKNKIRLTRGGVFCMAPDTVHRWSTRSAPVTILGFMLSLSPTSESGGSPAFGLQAAVESLGYRVDDPELARTFSLVLEGAAGEEPYGPQLVAARMRVALILFMRRLRGGMGLASHAPASGGGGARRRQLLLQAHAFIEANLAFGVSLIDVARHLGITGQHLNRLFRESEGIPVGRHIGDLRLERARKLLRSGESLEVKEIAARCGFNDVSYFCRFFRERTGKTPRQFAAGS
jgi:AraC-like DNA-binding protein